MWTKLWRWGVLVVVCAALFLSGVALGRNARRALRTCQTQVTTLQAAGEKARVRADTAVARYYRARDLYAQQVAVIAHVRTRVLYYARIVASRPVSAKYMLAWARRAFEEAPPYDSVPPSLRCPGAHSRTIPSPAADAAQFSSVAGGLHAQEAEGEVSCLRTSFPGP